ncbi:Homeodomain ZF-HD class domain-containing protein [Dioscorea alata]|uniref:Homeodomain ZF-HD class domain-containing protein n=3 Tax=Dioscorea alata TaxID=55571 RepID=A0ACB7WAZ6_DIOAL|nr:Homeodomain ZF-HD class domain-containing protein [Dioscorea alata]KAH7685141.1 Homeodomain ZF-HD class domain-containing protein [Dioscorea alata]KAH7685142.1 Homeodomain ZF-HD class domain-containing protein [Dioscorea alata]
MDLSGHEGVEMAIPISSTYTVQQRQQQQQQQALSQGLINGPHPPSEEQHQHNQKKPSSSTTSPSPSWVKYKECLKNHAASIGGNATDGCGEFMPSGEEGTIESFKCSACNCHRNFHRKETDVAETYSLVPRSAGGVQMVMPLGSFHTSESDEMDRQQQHHHHHHHHQQQGPVVRKRFRTKFTQEQKEKMLDFAESVGWRLQKQEESVVQHFCQEIGIKRRVLKVWMHNNKHNLAKKDLNDSNVVVHPHPHPPSPTHHHHHTPLQLE